MLTSLPILTFALAILLAGAGLVLAFFPRVPAVLLSFGAMLFARASGMLAFTSGQLWFWGVAAAIAAGLAYLAQPRLPRTCVYYIVGGALAGALVGLVIGYTAAVILASATGAFFAGMAFARTPAGRAAGPSATRLDVLAPVGLPAVVNFSIIMMLFAQLLHS